MMKPICLRQFRVASKYLLLTSLAVSSAPALAVTFTVSNTNVTGAGSLQQAIFDASTNAGADTITFAILSGGLTITPTNALPAIVEPLTIDGSTQPGFVNAPIIELNGASAGPLVDGLRVLTSNCVIRALAINRFNGDGIEITNASNVTVEGCYLGLGLDGVTSRANAQNGVNVTNAANCVIGGLNASNRNVIAGNAQCGALIGGATATNNTVLGNLIGLDINSADKGNSADGVRVLSSGNLIGGTNASARNVISGNSSDGIEINGLGATLNQVYANVIGSDASGLLNRANSGNGVLITTSARSNYLGDVAPGYGNTFAFNGGDGISVAAATANTNNVFRGNAIYLNGDLAIDLATSGVTANDAGDGDSGANQLQNFPVLTSATNTPVSVLIAGSLNSRAATTYQLDFYASAQGDPSGNGEGQYYLGSTNVTTDGAGNTNFSVSLPGTNFKGRFVSATATDPFGNTSEFATNVASVSTVSAATFTVINTNDSGVGSLRQAILGANASIANSPDTIAFNIPAGGIQTNKPASALPTITDSVVIDGYTQPASATNTSATGFNGTLLVRLDGTSAGAAVDGLAFVAPSNTLRGLIIVNFTDDGVDLSGGGGSVVEGNLLGANPDSTDGGNGADGLHVNGGGSNTIGGADVGARNVISWNTGQGVDISGTGAVGNRVLGNFIGTDLGGTLDRGNLSDGVLITSISNCVVSANVIGGNSGDGIEVSGTAATNTVVQGNFIGTDFTGMATNANTGSGINLSAGARLNVLGGVGQSNVIAFNGADGVTVAANNSATNNVIRANRIFLNSDLGIDLGTSGVTANDAGDPDAGANQLQNFPVLSAVSNSIFGTIVSGTLNSRLSTTYTLDFYSSVAADPGGNGEGQTWLGATNLTTGVDSNLAFTVSLAVTNLAGRYVTATSTDPFGNTSEFSPAVSAVSSVPGLMFTVVNTNDSGPGSLRDALNQANAAITAGDTIAFAITNLSTTIRLAGALPAIIDPVTIDGYTQSGAATNTSATLFSGTLLVRLDGTNAPSGSDGLRLIAGGNIIRGLVIINFLGSAADGIDVSGPGNNVIEGNLIGLDVDDSDRGNGGDGIHVVSSPGNLIGGAAPGARNVISGNGGQGVDISSTGASGNRILGNLIGTDTGGTLDLGNTSDGVIISGCPSNTIGGLTSGWRNVISGNNGDGIEISGTGAGGNLVLGNYIGTDAAGTAARNNAANGVLVSATGGNTVGGSAAGAGNLISGNTSDGIELSGTSCTNNDVKGNWIGTDVTGAAALANGGHGVLITSSAHDNVIGGSGNTIAFNAADGISVATGTNNALRHNLIFSNGDLGIDLGATSGVTANDPGDGDTGPNQLQNFPLLTAATNSSTNVVIAGTLGSGTNLTYALDFFASVAADAAGNGEGAQYLGSTNVTTDAAGNGSFTADLPVPPGGLAGRYLTATATDPFGNTSEFGPALRAVSVIPPVTLIVTNTADGGTGSLRQTLLDSNAALTYSNNLIQFNVSGPGSHVIAPASALPVIAEPMTIDGFTQPGASANTLTNGHNAVLKIRLDGAGAGAAVDGLKIAANGCVVRGLAITGFSGDGLELSSGAGNRVEGCYVGLDVDGLTVLGNAGNGVNVVTNAPSSLIGGNTPAARCVISGNNRGVFIGGSSSNSVQGCCVGTDAGGLLDRGNTNSGVFISTAVARFNVIGGANSSERNVISGNGEGFTSEGHGITLSQCVSNFILGNYIGTTASGTAALGNQDNGVDLAAASTNAIGGAAAGAGNVISGNDNGVRLGSSSAARGNWIQGNLIGPGASGTTPVANTNDGVSFGFANYNLIGGASAGARNVISGNNGSGLEINPSAAASNSVHGNFIGLDITGTNALGNGSVGVDASSDFNAIGGPNAGEGNVIAFNAGIGVMVTSLGDGCPILGNSIYSNSALGIDLLTPTSATGVSTNDPGDPDTGGNFRQNFPVLTRATTDTNSTTIAGSLNSRSNTTFRLEFFDSAACDPGGFGEGQVFVGLTNVVTDAVGNIAFAFTVSPGLAFGRFVTATATDPTNNTSEFSFCVRVVPFNSVNLGVSKQDSVDPIPLGSNLTYTIAITNAGPTNATGVTLTDPLPAGLTFVSATPSQGTCTNIGATVICNLGTLNNSNAASVSLVVTPTGTAVVTNIATVTAAEFDHELANNSASQSTALGVADLRVGITDSPDPITAGQVLTCVMTVTNAGPDPATGARAVFTAPAGFVILTHVSSQGTVAASEGTVTAQFGTLATGASATVTVTGVPTVTGLAEAEATVFRAEADPSPANDNGITFTTVQSGAGILQFSDLWYHITESGGSAFVTVRRTAGTAGAVTVSYATANLTALAGTDYTTASGTLTFTNGQSSNTFAVPIFNDSSPECNEEVRLSLFNATGGAVAIGQTNSVLQIFDDETSASGTIQAASLAATNVASAGDSGSTTATLSADGRYIAFESDSRNLVLGDTNSTRDVLLHDRSTRTTSLISHITNGANSASSQSYNARISADGRFVLFTSAADNLIPGDTNFVNDVFLYSVISGTNQVVSVGTNGASVGNGSSGVAAVGYPISSNGQVVAFESGASNLAANDANGLPDIFARDVASGVTKLASMNATGTSGGNGVSYSPGVSADGRFVVFESVANNLAGTDLNSVADIFIRNLTNNTTALVSVNSSGTAAGNQGAGGRFSLSADGRYVAFESTSSDLVTNDFNSLRDIFRRDLVTGLTEMASRSLFGTNGGNSLSTLRGMSADGRYVLFSSYASNLTTNDTSTFEDVFVRDMLNATTMLVSVVPGGTNSGNDDSIDGSITPDGRYVAFASYATNLAATGKNAFLIDVFLRDLITGTTTLISTRKAGEFSGQDDSYGPQVNATGQVVAFESVANDLADSDDNSSADIFAWQSGTNALITARIGVTGNNYSLDPTLSADGTKLAFGSYASNLATNDHNASADLFLRDVATGGNTLISVNASGNGTGNGESSYARLSADGRHVSFISFASDLVAGDSNSSVDIFRRDMLAGITALVSVNSAGSGPGNDDSYDSKITPDGRFVVFESKASNLVTNDANGHGYDVFIRDLSDSVPELVSVNAAGTVGGNNGSYDGSMSADGRWVAFETDASDLFVGDSNGVPDVIVRDRLGGSNILVSVNASGTGGGNGFSYDAYISDNGRYVVFESDASDLVAGDTNGTTDVFVRDLLTHTTRAVSVNSSGAGTGNDAAYSCSMSADGRYIAFESQATNLVANDVNGDFYDVFLRDVWSNTTTLVSINCHGTGSGNDYSYSGQVSSDGRYVTFASWAWDIANGDFADYTRNIFRRDLLTGQTVLVSQNLSHTGGGDGDSYLTAFAQYNAAAQYPRVMSADGGVVAFASYASDFVADDFNEEDDIFVWRVTAAVAGVDLMLDKSASTNQVVACGTITYTLAVTNTGSAAASGVVLTDNLPAALTFSAATTSQGSVTNVAGTVTASVGVLNPGAGAVVNITVLANNAGSVTNAATASSAQTDTTPANNTDSVVVTVTPLVPPTLSVQRSNELLLLRWPNATPDVFTLETTTNLAPVIVWTTVTNSVFNDGTNRGVNLTPAPADPKRFYRLRK